ncbi:hypothetical protein NE237_008614 [Protea cynaroides]|uniref:Uncharacterized protein n=1 Tax=Protea cynaroides TaxID=273540 RepID=A0A9Q0QZV1_9MAGN|nr:hypothetical protein NE237_008614 [Protea cynaroides]
MMMMNNRLRNGFREVIAFGSSGIMHVGYLRVAGRMGDCRWWLRQGRGYLAAGGGGVNRFKWRSRRQWRVMVAAWAWEYVSIKGTLAAGYGHSVELDFRELSGSSWVCGGISGKLVDDVGVGCVAAGFMAWVEYVSNGGGLGTWGSWGSRNMVRGKGEGGGGSLGFGGLKRIGGKVVD